MAKIPLRARNHDIDRGSDEQKDNTKDQQYLTHSWERAAGEPGPVAAEPNNIFSKASIGN